MSSPTRAFLKVRTVDYDIVQETMRFRAVSTARSIQIRLKVDRDQICGSRIHLRSLPSGILLSCSD
jgi:hypothetical protein